MKSFIDFCKNYSNQTGMQSTIRFTSSYSRTGAVFLDMKVSIKDNKICTTLYSKPVDTHTYLHASSFHSRSTLLSLPKTQFIRLRRLCSSLSDYRQHSEKFVDFFLQRGYKRNQLQKFSTEVADMQRDELLTPKPRPKPDDNPARTVLSIAWHPRLHFLQRSLHHTYSRFTTQYETLKRTFPEPPIVAFRKNRSLRDILVHARHGHKEDSSTAMSQNSTSRSMLQKNMSRSNSVTNEKANITVKTVGGCVNTRNLVYAAKCKRCKISYVGYTTMQLNERFNLHRSDVLHHPDRSELPGHFSGSPACDFERDLEVHILQKDLSGSRAILEAAEDKWILKLDTLAPNGMNVKLNEYGTTYKKLFC